jgi:Cu+-exporting ATPase
MKNLRIVHRLSRRIRVLAPSLIKEQERCYILEILLRKHPAIKDIRIVPEIGSLVIHYDPANLPEARLLATLDAVLGNLIAAPKAPPPAAMPVDGPVRECSVAIEGMTCASCALLVEMKLKRDPRVRSAVVNFASATLIAKACQRLSPASATKPGPWTRWRNVAYWLNAKRNGSPKPKNASFKPPG